MTTPELNTEEANRAAILRLYEECLNQHKLELADQLIAPGMITRGPNGGFGPEAYKRNVAPLLTAFPDIHFVVHDVVTQDDRVAVYWTWEATHRGSFNNIPPTGKRVKQEGMVMYRLADGQAIEAKVVFDRLGVFQQLGVPPQSPAPKPL
jgi:steroid delta-isomerase-like uncharacterized protein